ncbi:hypothetical protein DSCA_22040 [Desulfosarcina alkanivorans]|jgi:hypothetical protein|uniref:Uncharacterized protein n=1 Tax=Desulfosarcina alkanivorans TaxID=571177 RepID=A0A5K7YPI3_9BACT|nr:hypothetical protein [Desulfosarcina alkanivorans]BBO68274.1 hypothetical protein DSCA_22040 [Desulfosarcina alkanivorans]
MAWINVPGLAGRVYLPDDAGQVPKKHPCMACFSCQWCDENRCRVCRDGRNEEANPIDPASKGCCDRKQGACPSNLKSQAPNFK